MTEYQLSQWISQSLSGELSEQQRAELQAALERSPASLAFAEWSSRIQAAASLENQMQEEPDGEAGEERPTPDSSERLSEFSKERMRRAVRMAQTEYQSENSQQQHQFVAQSPAAYSHSRPVEPPYDSTSLGSSPQSKPPSQPPQDALVTLGRLLRDRLSSQFSSLAALGLPIAEADIDRLLRAEIAALGIKEDVWLIDGRGQILFSSSLAGRDALGQVGQTLAGWDSVLDEFSDSGETIDSELGAWVTSIACPSPLDILQLVLRR